MAYPADLLERVERAYLAQFHSQPTRASVSFLGVEQIEVLKFIDQDAAGSATGVVHYLSLGMSRYPMTDPGSPVVQDEQAPRAELLLSLTGEADQVWRTVAVLAAAPAVEGAVYSAGARLHLPEPLLAGSRCVGAVLTDGPLDPVTAESVADVQFLRLLPATATELAWAKVHGSAALLERWAQAATDLGDLLRDPVELER